MKNHQPNPMNKKPNDIGCCELCGGMVIRKHSNDGTRYYIPVTEKEFSGYLDQIGDTDLYTYDRLRRAEKIIVQLRSELKSKQK